MVRIRPRRLRVALHRHGGSEAIGGAASPGSRRLFESLERLLADEVELQRMPHLPIEADPRAATIAALQVLSWADLCILSIPHHINALDPLFLGRAKLRHRIPFLYLPLGEFPRGAPVYRQICRHFLPNDRLVFSSTADLECWHNMVARCPAEARVIPFGLDVETYRPSAAHRRRVRAHLEVPETRRVLVYHGRLDALKQVHTLVALFADVAQARPEAELWLIGRVSANLDLARLAAALPGAIRGRVRWLGELPDGDIPEVLAAADAGAYLTLNPDENFGFAPLEAMACGLPVIASAWGGLSDTMTSPAATQVPTGVTAVAPALYLPPARAALWRALGPTRRAEPCLAAVRHVEENYSLLRWRRAIMATIQDSVQAEPAGDAEPHLWTCFGQKFNQRNSNRAGAPVALPPDSYRLGVAPDIDRLLSTYSSRWHKAAGPPCVPSLHVEISGGRVRSRDPYYRFQEMRISSEEATCLRRALEAGARGWPAHAVRQGVLDRLTELGLLIAPKKNVSPDARVWY